MRKKQKEGAIDNSAPVAPFTTTTVALKYSAFPRQRVAALVGLISGLNPAAEEGGAAIHGENSRHPRDFWLRTGAVR